MNSVLILSGGNTDAVRVTMCFPVVAAFGISCQYTDKPGTVNSAQTQNWSVTNPGLFCGLLSKRTNLTPALARFVHGKEDSLMDRQKYSKFCRKCK